MYTLNLEESLLKNYKRNINFNLEFWTTKLKSRRKAMLRLRNSAIDLTINQYHKNFPIFLYNEQWLQDIAKTEDRAQHYGVSLGGTIKKYRKPRKDYRTQVAKLKRELRSQALKLEFINISNKA